MGYDPRWALWAFHCHRGLILFLFTAAVLRGFAARSRDAAQSRRLLALAMVLDGASRLEAARQAGMDRQTLRDWVHRYNEMGVDGPDPD